MQNSRQRANAEAARLTAKFGINQKGQELVTVLGEGWESSNLVAIREWVLRKLEAGIEEPQGPALEQLLARRIMEEFPIASDMNIA